MDIVVGMPDYKDIDVLILYLSCQNQLAYKDYILKLMPSKIIFNPGAECQEMERMAKEAGISCLLDCALMLIDSNEL